MKLVGIHLFLEYLLSSYLVDLNPQVPRCHSLHGILPWQLVLALHFLVVVLTDIPPIITREFDHLVLRLFGFGFFLFFSLER